MYGYQEHMMDGNNNGWGFGWLFLCLSILTILVVIAIYELRRHHNHTDISKPVPLDIIKARYARGEITKVEFDQLKKDLK